MDSNTALNLRARQIKSQIEQGYFSQDFVISTPEHPVPITMRGIHSQGPSKTDLGTGIKRAQREDWLELCTLSLPSFLQEKEALISARVKIDGESFMVLDISESFAKTVLRLSLA